MTAGVTLRAVLESDVPVFFEHQRDAESVAMAAFPAREHEAHVAHWKKTMANASTTLRTILFNEEVAGYVVSWNGSTGREVGYWLGRGFWGRGIATQALRLFLQQESRRPLFGHVARHNLASRRVLEKCGFVLVGAAGVQKEPSGDPIGEIILRLDRTVGGDHRKS
jgi:RimJ/RimL family protein N-acetyltransferase